MRGGAKKSQREIERVVRRWKEEEKKCVSVCVSVTACLWRCVWAELACPCQRREAVDSTCHRQGLAALVLISLCRSLRFTCTHSKRDILVNPKSLPSPLLLLLLLRFIVRKPQGIKVYTEAARWFKINVNSASLVSLGSKGDDNHHHHIHSGTL